VLVEPAVQRALIRGSASRALLGAGYIASQVIALPLALGTAFRGNYPAYPALRTMALMSWAAGVAWYAWRPVAPPRMLPEMQVADTVSEGFLPLDSPLVRFFYNPYAAMPSLHVGMAPVVAWVGTAVVVGIAPCPGCPVARQRDEKSPASWLARDALSIVRRDEVFPIALTRLSSVVMVINQSLNAEGREEVLRKIAALNLVLVSGGGRSSLHDLPGAIDALDRCNLEWRLTVAKWLQNYNSVADAERARHVLVSTQRAPVTGLAGGVSPT
jgi:hypothetical protein